MSAPSAPAAGVRVSTSTRRLPPFAALPAYTALTERFGSDGVYLLESAAGPARDRRYQFLGFGPLVSVSVTDGVVDVRGTAGLRGTVLERLRPLLEDAGGRHAGRLRAPRELWPVLRELTSLFDAQGATDRFRFGFLAYFGYDTARYTEDLPHLIERRPALPDVQFVLHQGCVVADLADGRTELLVHHSPGWPRLDAGEIAALLAGAADSHPEPAGDRVPGARVTDDTRAEVFAADVERCLEHIRVGDVYQVQIGHELTMDSPVDPMTVYRRLRARNPSPYMYLTGVAGQQVIGASPELFVRIEDDTVTMRPIAGTVPRTGAGADLEASHRLLADPKEVAEHTMLVDLCRNDIGRIARRDTLHVTDQFAVERYSHVLHLVSTVHGHAEHDALDVIAALFPAGTMTGTPKIRAMEIIESVERSRRGLYAGALGLIDVGGYTNLALCIRTLFRDGTRYRTRASAGIVADSVPGAEWKETLAKMSATHWAVTGRELL